MEPQSRGTSRTTLVKSILHLDNGVQVDVDSGEVFHPRLSSYTLPPKAHECLKKLVAARGRLISYEVLQQGQSDRDYIGDPRAAIRDLRLAFDDDNPQVPHGYYVVNIWGRGYKLDHCKLERLEIPDDGNFDFHAPLVV